MYAILQQLKIALQAAGADNRSLLVAVSGGADSMALWRGLLELRKPLGLDLTAAHLNHGLRGDAARSDAEWLQQEAVALDAPLIVGVADVPSLAEATGDGIEEAARTARYRFLEQAARECHAEIVVTAHNAGDQAETILHHVLRGTGLGGLRGIPVERPLAPGIRLLRPLLAVDRVQIEEYLRSLRQAYREDHTNRDRAFTRNRIRGELLPLLTREYNVNVQAALVRLAQQAGEAQDALEFLADQALQGALVSQTHTECSLRWGTFDGAPRHLVREVFCRLWRRLQWPRQSMGHAQWEQLARIALEGGAAHLPGQVDVRRQDALLILRRMVEAARPNQSSVGNAPLA